MMEDEVVRRRGWLLVAGRCFIVPAMVIVWVRYRVNSSWLVGAGAVSGLLAGRLR